MPPPLDFKEIAQSIDIEAVATHARLKPHKDRLGCPTCGNERSIELFPETNTFACYTAPKVNGKTLGGDCIRLYAHVMGYEGQYKAAKELHEHFLANARQVQSTSPNSPTQRQEKQKEKSAPNKPFDPIAFGAKLAYSEEVKALGISEEDAERFTIGFYRGRVYLPMRDSNGSIAGFIGYASGELKMPPQWLPQATNVVPIRRGA